MSEYKRLTSYMQVGDKVVAIQPQRKERIQAYINRLFELEDKIESGQLVELKYKEGDYVFFISWLSGNVCEGTVVGWQEDGGYCINCGDDMISAYECFSTEAEAVARLEALEQWE